MFFMVFWTNFAQDAQEHGNNHDMKVLKKKLGENFHHFLKKRMRQKLGPNFF